MKQGTGSPPTLRPGQRLKQGDISGINRFVPQEIKGGQGVTIKSVGNRHIVQVRQRKGGRSGAGNVIYLGSFTSPPAIPSNDALYFFYGNGSQMWMAHGGDTVWTPAQYLTTASGTP
jgi:hypothetical protein